MEDEKVLYRYQLDCGRAGCLEAVFVSTRQEVAEAIGSRVDFGEAFGKHSSVTGVLEELEFQELTDDQDFIAKFLELNCENGKNPLHYLSDDEEDEVEDG